MRFTIYISPPKSRLKREWLSRQILGRRVDYHNHDDVLIHCEVVDAQFWKDSVEVSIREMK